MLLLYIALLLTAIISIESLVHPSCMGLFINGSVPLSSGGFYKRRELPKPAYYDHSSCFLMKARYNCMDSRLKHSNNSLTDWQLMLAGYSGKDCTLDQLFSATGGIHQVAKNIRSWSHRRENVTHTNVLILGNSFLRQVFEAITCRYRANIVNGLVSVNATQMSISNSYRPFGVVDMGEILPMNEFRAGCHGSNATHYYEPQFLPPQSYNCSDSTAMVELDEGLRIYYIFRHFNYNKDLPILFDKLHLNISKIDVVVTNNVPAQNHLLFTMLHPHVPIIEFDALSYLQKIQTRDCGWWDGAHNIGLVMAADEHPCMPGIPDDEADLLLFMLAKRILKIS